jgi:predicted DNA-binding ribbon-helix-helix protein
MKPSIKKHTVVIAGRNTSITLEDEFWRELKLISAAEKITLRTLVAQIDAGRRPANLSSAVRLFVIDYLRKKSTSTHDL